MTADQQPVARPVYAFDYPASMAQRVRVARAIKVLHGPDCREYQIGPKYVVYGPGELCPCNRCLMYLMELADLGDGDMPEIRVVCTECGQGIRACSKALDHEDDCSHAPAPAYPAYAGFLIRHPDATRHAPDHEIADDYERNEHA